MFSQEDVNMIAPSLPNSSVMEIHRRTGISRTTIYKFLKGDRIRSRLQQRIYIAALKIIEKNKKKESEIKKFREQILNMETTNA